MRRLRILLRNLLYLSKKDIQKTTFTITNSGLAGVLKNASKNRPDK